MTGRWKLDPSRHRLIHTSGAAVDLKRCQTRVEIEDLLRHLSRQSWCSGTDLLALRFCFCKIFGNWSSWLPTARMPTWEIEKRSLRAAREAFRRGWLVTR